MANFISITTTVAGAQPIIFNTINITSVLWLTATTFVIYSGAKSFTFTTSAAGAAGAVAAINNAMFSIAGPVLSPVLLPTGVTIGALPVVA